jgi:hypothetical protein
MERHVCVKSRKYFGSQFLDSLSSGHILRDRKNAPDLPGVFGVRSNVEK